MRILRFIVLLISLFLLQTIVISRYAIFGVRADLLLIITTLYAVNFGAEKGLVVGLLCGIVQDIFGGMLYISTISKGVLGFLIGTLKESVLGTEETVVLTAILAATVTNYFFELVLLFFFFGKPLASPLALFITLVISCLYNSALTFVLLPAFKASTRYFMEEQ